MTALPPDDAARLADLPIEPVIPALRAALRDGRAAVLQAPPGAGKTTRVPLALLDEEWLAGNRVVMLEPRRLATRAAARRMAALLDDAPIITCEGRSFPVETRYLALPRNERLETNVVAGISRALAEAAGSLLVFLPGVGEIRRVERALDAMELGEHIRIAPLYGELPQAAQDAARLPPETGTRQSGMR